MKRLDFVVRGRKGCRFFLMKAYHVNWICLDDLYRMCNCSKKIGTFNALDYHWMNLFLFKYSIVYPGWKPGSVWLRSKLFNCNLKSVPCDGWVSIEMWSTRERCVGVVGGAAANIFSIIFKTIFFSSQFAAVLDACSSAVVVWRFSGAAGQKYSFERERK